MLYFLPAMQCSFNPLQSYSQSLRRYFTVFHRCFMPLQPYLQCLHYIFAHFAKSFDCFVVLLAGLARSFAGFAIQLACFVLLLACFVQSVAGLARRFDSYREVIDRYFKRKQPKCAGTTSFGRFITHLSFCLLIAVRVPMACFCRRCSYRLTSGPGALVLTIA
jgi:hypothetical protein